MTAPIVHIVDDDDSVRAGLAFLLRAEGYDVTLHASGPAFLQRGPALHHCCLLTDIRMPQMDGLELQMRVNAAMPGLPVIIMTGHGDVPLAVRAMRAGAVDFLEKPFSNEALLDSIRRALAEGARAAERDQQAKALAQTLAGLTPREREVLDLLVEGHPNKVVAHRLGISVRTVEVHRVHVMDKMQARTIAELVRKALAAP